ncbi:MAG: hypothetical protein IPM86_06415 [Saprospiraceae bacterium]|nr:hypothetical protein [Saprospiraceae bacterium]
MTWIIIIWLDDNDDCFRISSQPFVWTAYPLADAGKADSVCGLNYVMQRHLTLGQGSWRQNRSRVLL